MKTAIHPTYHAKAKVSCACGNAFEVGSTKEEIRVELCNQCHPFYTGQQKFVDTARRVEKFQEKMERTKAAAEARKGKKAKRAARAAAKKNDEKTEPKPKAKKEKKAEPTPAPAVEVKPEETPADDAK